MKKFPRTPHLPFSPGCTNDDKRLDNCDQFINQTVLITEKLDGGNCCIYNGKVYARTHATEANHPSFNIVKNWVSNLPLNALCKDVHYYFENMYAVHSIEYEKLDSFMYLISTLYEGSISVWDQDIWWGLDDHGIPCVPLLDEVHIKTESQLQKLIHKHMKIPSKFGGSKEGLVIANRGVGGKFKYEDYSKNVAKYVRANHVQTDEHWSKNWRKATILK